MTDKQSEALRLAEAFESLLSPSHAIESKAAAELRRLHEINAELVEALEKILPGAEEMGWEVTKAKAALSKAQKDNK